MNQLTATQLLLKSLENQGFTQGQIIGYLISFLENREQEAPELKQKILATVIQRRATWGV